MRSSVIMINGKSTNSTQTLGMNDEEEGIFQWVYNGD